MAKDKEQLLEEFKRDKANRRPSEIVELLCLFGFTARRTKRGHTVWTNGKTTLTVPEPHGRERVLLVAYVGEVIRKIEEVRALDESGATSTTGNEARDEEDA